MQTPETFGSFYSENMGGNTSELKKYKLTNDQSLW